MFVYMSDVTIMENSLVSDIICFEFGKVILTKNISFLSNKCSAAIYLGSSKIPYTLVMNFRDNSEIKSFRAISNAADKFSLMSKFTS